MGRRGEKHQGENLGLRSPTATRQKARLPIIAAPVAVRKKKRGGKNTCGRLMIGRAASGGEQATKSRRRQPVGVSEESSAVKGVGEKGYKL